MRRPFSPGKLCSGHRQDIVNIVSEPGPEASQWDKLPTLSAELMKGESHLVGLSAKPSLWVC